MSTIFADKFKNTSGGNPVQINQLRGIDTAGSITVQGEGTATTILQEGLAKTRIRFNQQGTPAITDSFNIASIVDGGTGDTTLTITNDYANVNYTINAQNDDNSVTNQIVSADVFTVSYRQRTVDGNNALVDAPINYTITHGDLA